MDDITQAMVRDRLLYVKALGSLVWLRQPVENFPDANTAAVWNSRYAGLIAGSIGSRGYRSINIFGKMRKASRLTWLYHYGYWPEVVDHINGKLNDDSIENLRDVTQAENCKNRALGARNKTGVPGVFLDGGRIRAEISAGGRKHYLGCFPTVEEAAVARRMAEARFGYHPNHGRAPEQPRK